MKSAGDIRLDPATKLNPDEDGVFGARTDPRTYMANLKRESTTVVLTALTQLLCIPAIVFAMGRLLGFNGEFWAMFLMLGLGLNLVVGAIGALNINFRLQKYDNEVFMRTIIHRLSQIEKEQDDKALP